ncbi:MAG: hypothetical protein ACREUT_18575 [Steroidobacteraceae bacterium]
MEFAHRTRVLLLRHNASGIDVDMTFGGLPFCSRIELARPTLEDIFVRMVSGPLRLREPASRAAGIQLA